jgi:hypothetical protein
MGRFVHGKKLFGIVTAALAVSLGAGASAAVIRLDEAQFLPSAGLITFSEFALGTVNPVYTPADYGGGPGSPTVMTGGYFLGQQLSADPGTDCPGAAATACIVGTPAGPLSLDPAAPETSIRSDGDNPTSPVLSGSPIFDGPIALIFSEDQVGVGFDAGFFNAVGSTGITAFNRAGGLLGTVANTGLGIEFLGLITDDGLPQIAGVFLELIGNEPAGFAIDNIRFGQAEDIAPIPLPAALPMLLGALGLLGLMRTRRAAA